jgi:hypothetical protein
MGGERKTGSNAASKSYAVKNLSWVEISLVFRKGVHGTFFIRKK